MKRSYKHLEELREEYRLKRRKIAERLNDYRRIPEEDYFYELCYCLMTPQSSAVNAAKAQAVLETNDFRQRDIDPEPLLHRKEYYVRFHRTKSKHLRMMKSGFEGIFQVVAGPMTAAEKRLWLVDNVLGFSYKEATHFLRNIGKNDGLAILDRHILKNLKYHGAVRSLPGTLTGKKYLSIEKKFQVFSTEIGISVDELDLLFWSNETGEILK